MRKARHIPQLGEENECKFAKVVNTNVGVDKYGQTLIGCQCKCGNYFTATIARWNRSKGLSCGCTTKDIPFRDWARANGYDDSLTIDRIDYNKGYSPDNCRWADRKIQSNNKSDNVVLEYQGEKHNLTEWAERLSIPVSRIRSRYRAGWTIEEMLTTGGKKTRGWRERENIGI